MLEMLPQMLDVSVSSEGNSTIKLIVMGVLLVVFVAIFIIIRKKTKKK